MVKDAGIQIGQSASDGLFHELNADHETGLVVETEQHRPPASGGFPLTQLVHQATGDEVGGDAGHAFFSQ